MLGDIGSGKVTTKTSLNSNDLNQTTLTVFGKDFQFINDRDGIKIKIDGIFVLLPSYHLEQMGWTRK